MFETRNKIIIHDYLALNRYSHYVCHFLDCWRTILIYVIRPPSPFAPFSSTDESARTRVHCTQAIMFTWFFVILNRVEKSFSGSNLRVILILIAKYKHTPPLFVKSVHTTPYLWNLYLMIFRKSDRFLVFVKMSRILWLMIITVLLIPEVLWLYYF